MSYNAKTDWGPDDPVTEHDLNRWENGILSVQQSVIALEESLNDGTNSKLASVTADLAKVVFELSVMNIVTVSDLRHVYIDRIEQESDIVIRSGYFESGSVKI